MICNLGASSMKYAKSFDVGLVSFIDDCVRSVQNKSTVYITAGLVCIDTGKRKHHATQEYFISTRDRWFPNASAEVAQVCLHRVSIEALSTHCSGPDEEFAFGQRKQRFPFLHYAFLYWGSHTREASLDTKTQVPIWNYVKQ